MLNEFELLECFSPSFLDNNLLGKGHPYSKCDPYEITYLELPLLMILRSLLFKEGRDYLSLPKEDREEFALDARKVLLCYLGKEENPWIFAEEKEFWKDGMSKLFHQIYLGDGKKLEKVERSIKETIEALDPKNVSIFDLSIKSDKRDKPDIFCFDELLSKAVAMGPLCRYGFNFEAGELEKIFRFYQKIGLTQTEMVRHFLYCLYVYAMESRYNVSPFIEISRRNFRIMIENAEAKKDNDLMELKGRLKENDDPILALYPGIENSNSKLWAYRFYGYPTGWGKDPEKEISISFVDEKFYRNKPYEKQRFYTFFPSLFPKKETTDLIKTILNKK